MPVVNENDPVADDELRFSDNDRIAALVANLLGAELLVLLTDIAGLYDADPRRCARGVARRRGAGDRRRASRRGAGGPGRPEGSGGMAAKLAAARMACWSGVRVVIAAADRPGVLAGAVDGEPGVGTVFFPERRRLSARKLWIAFALPAAGRVIVDDGARLALVERDASLLPAGVVSVEGTFGLDDAIEIAGSDGVVFAKGIARLASARAPEWRGRRSIDRADVAPGRPSELVHRDNLAVLIGAVGERR